MRNLTRLAALPTLVAASASALGATLASGDGPLLSFDVAAAIWTIAVFVGLLLILRFAAWDKILKALQDREKFIRESIDGARREREEADKLLAKYKSQIDHARVEATAIVEEGRRDAEDVKRRIQEEARKESEEMIARARREIEIAGADAMKKIYDQAAELTVELAGRVIGKALSADDHRRLVAESLERSRSSGNLN